MPFTFNINDYDNVEPLPLPLEDPSGPALCSIMYSDEYKEALGLLRRLLLLNELSVRAFNLSTHVIELAPAFYTAWNYRYRVVEHLVAEESKLASDAMAPAVWLNRELDWLDEFTLSNPKNYQIWSYRQALIANLHPQPALARELPITQLMVDDDSKNYHVWAHRKWACAHFADWSHERRFALTYIQRDPYNNSAWAHRLATWSHDPWDGEDAFAAEFEWTKELIARVPQNVSSWQYLRGLCALHKWDQTLLQRCMQLCEQYNDESSYALEFYGYLCSRDDVNRGQDAVAAYEKLAETMDPIRSGLWRHKVELLRSKHN